MFQFPVHRLSVSDYTKSMGGCDRNDQLIKLYRRRKHYRWPCRLIMKCITWSSYNASKYIIAKHLKSLSAVGVLHSTLLNQGCRMLAFIFQKALKMLLAIIKVGQFDVKNAITNWDAPRRVQPPRVLLRPARYQ